jgi:hypothetical protein
MVSRVYRRSVELLEAEIDDELVALEPQKGNCFGFNAVAKDVWRMLEKPLDLEQLKRKIVAQYEVEEEQCARELQQLLDEMLRVELIEVVKA